ncbi:hypothetical protein [Novosphingobium sp.]|uniref:hypothetical protein n=1 Tax=Novosphingobium sp. TaxID=1874826 RepID=UPI00261B0C6C|nr:hypothetical protein [Novosphingobium sp.]
MLNEANSQSDENVSASLSIEPKDPVPQTSQSKPSRRGGGAKRNYPMFSLAKALSIGQTIKTNNAGNPWPPTEVSKSLGYGEKSSTVDLLFRAASLYGISSGTRAASSITLEKIGRDILYASSPESELKAKRAAFLNVDIFSKVLEYYHGNNLPKMEFLSNTLFSEFSIPVEFHQEFKDIFEENCDFVQIGKEWQGLNTPARDTITKRTASPAVISYSAEANPSGLDCFVIMPFSERLSSRPKGFFDEVFESLIKPAAESAGFDVYTANKDGSDVIQSTIINELMNADLVIADLTDHNPNVLFELGMRMALEKPVAIIKTQDTGGIFDVDNMLRVFEYSQNLWLSTIKSDVPRLEGHLRATWDQRETTRTYISILRNAGDSDRTQR